MIVLLAAGLISMVLMIGALAAFSRRPPDSDLAEATRPVLIGFLVAAGGFSLASGLAALPDSSSSILIASNLRFTCFIWTILATFSLVVGSAGLMQQALQVIARTGVVILLLLQFPLWEGIFFHDAASPERAFLLSGRYEFAGLINVLILLFYIGAAAFLLWLHRPRLISRNGRLALFVLLAGQTLTLLYPESSTMGVVAAFSAFVGIILVFEPQRNSKLANN